MATIPKTEYEEYKIARDTLMDHINMVEAILKRGLTQEEKKRIKSQWKNDIKKYLDN